MAKLFAIYQQPKDPVHAGDRRRDEFAPGAGYRGGPGKFRERRRRRDVWRDEACLTLCNWVRQRTDLRKVGVHYRFVELQQDINGRCASGAPGAYCAAIPHVAGASEFQGRLVDGGPRAALEYLNSRTPHRFTGVFQFSGQTLKSIELVDKWDASVNSCDDIPVAKAYCSHLQRTGESLVVVDGAQDPRVPWMRDSPVISYCGAPIEGPSGEMWGALCHFDLHPCQTQRSEVQLVVAAARVLWHALVEDEDARHA